MQYCIEGAMERTRVATVGGSYLKCFYLYFDRSPFQLYRQVFAPAIITLFSCNFDGSKGPHREETRRKYNIAFLPGLVHVFGAKYWLLWIAPAEECKSFGCQVEHGVQVEISADVVRVKTGSSNVARMRSCSQEKHKQFCFLQAVWGVEKVTRNPNKKLGKLSFQRYAATGNNNLLARLGATFC
jgi:hypothetical protein